MTRSSSTSHNGVRALTGPLKLKQASAVLRIEPKELQNLVQFGVIVPALDKSQGVHEFDLELLYRAKIAICLKRNLGASYERLKTILASNNLEWPQVIAKKPTRLVLDVQQESCESLKLVLPFREIVGDLESRLQVVDIYRDLPRGRKRPGWKEDFLATLDKAAEQLEDVSQEDIARDIEEYRTKLGRV